MVATLDDVVIATKEVKAEVKELRQLIKKYLVLKEKGEGSVLLWTE